MIRHPLTDNPKISPKIIRDTTLMLKRIQTSRVLDILSTIINGEEHGFK